MEICCKSNKHYFKLLHVDHRLDITFSLSSSVFSSLLFVLDEDEEEPPPLFIPEEPSPILYGVYSPDDPDTFWVSMVRTVKIYWPLARMSHAATVPRSPFWFTVNTAPPKMRTSLNNAQRHCPPLWRIQDYSDDNVRWIGSILFKKMFFFVFFSFLLILFVYHGLLKKITFCQRKICNECTYKIHDFKTVKMPNPRQLIKTREFRYKKMGLCVEKNIIVHLTQVTFFIIQV